jgi:hypothetical protein
MKTASSHIINKNHGIQNTISHHIKSENYGIIFNILRKQLYTDLILAPIREVSANAVDAHTEAGKADLPIKVTLPTQLDSFLRVRDFGFGLSDEKIAELYSGYGDSNKRGTNDAIGGFGIGKFSPLAYGDSFIINSYQNGTVHSWNSYIDASNRGAMSKMGSAPTTEPNGLEIIVPVKGTDVNAFREKAINLFAYFKIVPNVVNITDDEKAQIEKTRNVNCLFSNDFYKYTSNGRSLVVMGGIAYSINSSVFSDELSPEARIILDNGIILNFNIGDLEIAASRETLNYSENTKKKLADKLNEVANDLIAQVNDSFKNCSTLWNAKCLYREVFDYYGKLYSLRRFIGKKLVFNGQTIESDHFSFQREGFQVISYYKKHNSWRSFKRVQANVTDVIDARKNHAVVLDDLSGAAKCVKNRITPLIEEGKYETVYLISFASDEVKEEFIKTTGFDHEMINLSFLPKEKLSKYYGSTGSGSIRTKKHTKKEFIFDINYKPQQSIYSSKKSDFYQTADIDISSDSGVYVIIDHFCFEAKDGRICEPVELRHFIQNCKNAGIDLPTIYCIKSASRDKVKNNPKMVLLWDWAKNAAKEMFSKNPKALEELSNYVSMKKWIYADPSCTKYGARFDTISQIARNSSIMSGDMFDFFNHFTHMYNNKGEEYYFMYLKFFKDEELKPTYNIEEEIKTLEKKYPMAFAIISLATYHDITPYIVDMDNYIRLIDGV